LVGLLDVNVIIALVVRTHVHHDIAYRWLVEEEGWRDGWATCPLVELGAMRLLINPKIAQQGDSPEQQGDKPMLPRRTARAMLSLRRAVPGYVWWPDDVPAAGRFEVRASQTAKQVTDRYIIGLARRHRGRVITLDQPLANSAGSDALNLLRRVGAGEMPSS
jgi:toxin-antitoxin system PIN domain toxin